MQALRSIPILVRDGLAARRSTAASLKRIERASGECADACRFMLSISSEWKPKRANDKPVGNGAH